MAQLMRVFVAVPEGPVEVHLRPMVQPAPTPCPIFHPGKDPLKIPQGDIWVLRLPYPFSNRNLLILFCSYLTMGDSFRISGG